jgi:hypothetical protein
MISNFFFIESLLQSEGFRCSRASYDNGVLLFEDESIMGFVSSFENVEELLRNWKIEQNRFIAKMAVPLRQAARKSWNCYAILISQSPVPTPLRAEFLSLEEDLTLTRKLVGDGISSPEDVERLFVPVLSIRHHLSTPHIEEESPLSRLTGWSDEAKRLLDTDASTPIDLIEALLGDQQ